MQYMGGKGKIAQYIAAAIPDASIVEPFCGGLNVTAAFAGRVRIAADTNQALIALYRAWGRGWRPPQVDREAYAEIRAKKDTSDPITAFCGFGLSFGGKWFGGYASNAAGQDYHGGACRSLDRKFAAMADAPLFIAADYAALTRLLIPGDALYCDPPYAGTTDYTAARGFDSASFWSWCAQHSEDRPVYVSEYTAPDGWRVVGEWAKTRGVDRADKGRGTRTTEKLFTRNNPR